MSPLPKINFADIKGPEPVPAGDYILEVMTATPGVSKAGNDKISMRFRIASGPYEGRNVFDNLTFTEASLFRIKQFMVAAGYDPDFEGEVEPEDFVGKVVSASVTIRAATTSDEGELYPAQNQIRKYASVEDTTLEDLM